MEEKYQKLIDKQIEKLSADDFDLDAWKSSASYVIKIIFGPKDPKIEEINKLKIDYSSWALRDSSPNYKPIETCKKKGKEILEIAKDEIELLGVSTPATALNKKLKSLLSDEMYEKFIEGNEDNRLAALKSLKKDQLVDLVKLVVDFKEES
ncbi:MAG: hypothetical protein R3345_08515 [Fulvivirga sp.]|nr:hypothetical protein [Fulvivirga sp.]